MNRALIVRSIRDSWMLLASCCMLTFALMCLRVWVSSRINIEHFLQMFAEGLSFIENLLPVPLSDWISPLGRTVFTYEEPVVILLLALWTVARGSECVVGRVENGTMELLLAQPLRRFTIVTSHSAVSLAGVLVLGIVSIGALATGLSISKFDERPELAAVLPATISYVGFGTFLLGAATLVSAVARTRAQAVAIVIAFYVVQLAFVIIARLSPSWAWLEYLSILPAYEPTRLAIEMQRGASTGCCGQASAWLFGVGTAAWLAAATVFCHRDVPAPL
jgi:ABC-type transport system involved in multi-copper enzyme maturation permease subunit